VTLSSSTFVYLLEAHGGCGSQLVECVSMALGLCKSCLWLLDYAFKSFWFVFILVVVLHLQSWSFCI
jgi:hypothetical protein